MGHAQTCLKKFIVSLKFILIFLLIPMSMIIHKSLIQGNGIVFLLPEACNLEGI